jgi:hypothetical protein
MVRTYLTAHASELTAADDDLTAFIVVHTIEALSHATVLSRPDLLKRVDFVSELSALILNYLRPSTPSR